MKNMYRANFWAHDLGLMDLSFAGFGPPKFSELRPINLSFEDSIHLSSENLGPPNSSDARSMESSKLRLMGLSSENLGPTSSEIKARALKTWALPLLRSKGPNCEDLGRPKTSPSG